MNPPPSMGATGIFAVSAALRGDRSARSIRRRLIVLIGIAAVAVVSSATLADLYELRRSMAGDENACIVNAASLSRQLVEGVLAERVRHVGLIATSPAVINATNEGAAEIKRLGLRADAAGSVQAAELASIEARFARTRSLQVDS